MNLYDIRDGQLQLRFDRNRLQAETWRSDRRFTFMVAGTQSGKTTFGPWWLWREWQRCGSGDYLAVTATYDLFKLKMLPEMLRVYCDLLGWGTYHATDRVILGKDGSRIILRSANSPGGLESATAKAAWLDECGQDDFTLLAWEAVLRRLALAEGPVLGTTTPYNMGWLKTEIMDTWLAGDPDYLVIQGASTENPAFPMAEYERARRTMPAWKFAMFYQGLFERPAGLIYADFTDAHLVDPFSIPVEWPRYVGIDFGAVNTAILWIAEDVHRGGYYVYREYLEGGRTTAEHAAAVLRLSEGERVVRWMGGAKSEQQYRWDWIANGVPANEPPVAEMESGIDAVTGLLKTKRLFVFRDLRGLRDEMGTYSRQMDANGQVTEKIKDKERFHRLDALRYAVLGITTLQGDLFV